MKFTTLDTYYSSLFSLLLLLPVALNLGNLTGKPIDIVLSDFIIIFSFVYLFLNIITFNLKIPKSPVITLTFILVSYCFVLALFGVFFTGEFVPIFSVMKFVKPFLFVFIGWWYVKRFGLKGLRNIIYASVFIITIILLTDIISSNFPHGCIGNGRWGGCFMIFEIYGFPNSSASFLVILLALLISGFEFNLKWQIILFITCVFVIALSILSLSRAAWAFVLWLLSVWLFFSIGRIYVFPKKSIFSLLFLGLLGLVISIFIFSGNEIVMSFWNKLRFSFERDDITSGRLDIWIETIKLISSKPLFGYAFEPFSNYVPGFDTPHNQYLEWAYKTGFIGLLLWIIFFSFFIHDILKVYRNISPLFRKAFSILVIGGFGGLLINGIFQPIISYSSAGNLLMFGVGVVAFYSTKVKKHQY